MKRKPKNPIHKVRTGSGDAGTTYLRTVGVPKSDPIVQFAGDVDEALCAMAKAKIRRMPATCETVDVQLSMIKMHNASIELMFQIGAMIHNTALIEEHGGLLSNYVDDVTTRMSIIIESASEQRTLIPLEGFIVPDDDNVNEMLARAVIRRAERSAVISDSMWAVPALNTMSDLFFLIAWHNSVSCKQWTGF